MISSIYFVLTLVTVGNLVYLAQKKYKHADQFLWTLLVLIPITNFGYWIKSTVHSPEAGMITLCLLNMCNTVAIVICLFIICQEVGINVSGAVKSGIYGITSAHLISIWLSKDNALYYSTLEIRENYLGSATVMTPGPLKHTHYIFLGLVLGAMLTVSLYGVLKKKYYSKKTLGLYISFVMLSVTGYAVELIADFDFSVLPVVYTIGDFVATFSYDYFQCHDLMSMIGEKQSQTGLRGFAAVDQKRRLLEYNKQFGNIVPEIKKIGMDEKIDGRSGGLLGELYTSIDLFEEENISTRNINIGESIYSLTVSVFSVNRLNQKNGYLLEIADITEETKRREIIEKYNEMLSAQVKEKTEHIADIQNTVVLGLANMVENRDDNTGGHVKRTSDVIKLFMEEILRRRTYEIDEQIARDIIKAAPMHDLGKIAIDNSILCKPEKLTEEEYEIMKSHAPRSGEIVKIILQGVEEEHFVKVAFNVARHHHERWDGKGYPDRLLGERIPVEARIMAVADVYDALVSKRCYKEPMSFEKAYDIMDECMGSQFDPAMRPIFIACRPKLEAYYKEANQLGK